MEAVRQAVDENPFAIGIMPKGCLYDNDEQSSSIGDGDRSDAGVESIKIT